MTIYYVTQGAAGGGVGSEADPFTLAEAAAAVVAGDKVYIKADADYVDQDGTSGQILNLQTAANIGSPIEWEGYTTTPGDGGMVTFDQSVNSVTKGVGTSINTYNQIFKNIRCTGGTNGWDHSNATGDRWLLINCRGDNQTLRGIRADASTHCINCTFDNNGSDGADLGASSNIVGSYAYNNVNHAFYASGLLVAFGCVAWNSTGSNKYLYYAPNLIAINCVADGENISTVTGFYMASTYYNNMVLNSIIYDCNVGIRWAAASGSGVDARSWHQQLFNLFYSNTSDVTNAADNGFDPVTGTEDPFTDSANGDFTLKTSSEAEDAGLDHGTVLS